VTPRIVGIDLSLTGLGLVAFPGDWDLDWRRIAHERHGEKLSRGASDHDRLGRMNRLADAAARFCESVRATNVWVEGYPGSGRVYGLPALCELGGIVRHRLAGSGLWAATSPLTTARKLVLGKLPRRDVKRILHETLRTMGAPASWSGDELDAWVAANFGASELGACCIVAPGVAA
jgi:hypothetical protein